MEVVASAPTMAASLARDRFSVCWRRVSLAAVIFCSAVDVTLRTAATCSFIIWVTVSVSVPSDKARFSRPSLCSANSALRRVARSSARTLPASMSPIWRCSSSLRAVARLTVSSSPALMVPRWPATACPRRDMSPIAVSSGSVRRRAVRASASAISRISWLRQTVKATSQMRVKGARVAAAKRASSARGAATIPSKP